MTSKRSLKEASALLRTILSAVEAGELTADTPTERRLLRRIEGAIAACDALEEAPKRKDS